VRAAIIDVDNDLPDLIAGCSAYPLAFHLNLLKST
jgi:hypothetical protein